MTTGLGTSELIDEETLALWAEKADLEQRIENLGWHQFIKRSNLETAIYEIDNYLWAKGFNIAAESLEKCGILKKV